jgi:hypothetical protein
MTGVFANFCKIASKFLFFIEERCPLGPSEASRLLDTVNKPRSSVSKRGLLYLLECGPNDWLCLKTQGVASLLLIKTTGPVVRG